MTVLAMILLATACWVLRVLFILVIPADRLPGRVRSSLAHLAPATLAALVAVETDALLRGASLGVTAYVLVAVAVTAAAVSRTGSLLLAIGISTGAALILDLVVLA